MKLLNQSVLDVIFQGERFSQSHGAEPRESYLGVGLLYYYLTYQTRANLCVCLGSGSGFVPKLMRQAQRDLGGGGRTILIDANIKDPKAGIPDYHDEVTDFRRNFSDVEVWKMTTLEAAPRIEQEIDFLHIDADHSTEAVLQDYFNYSDKVKPGGYITFHDTESLEVSRAINQIWPNNRAIVRFPFGNGTSLMRR